MTENLRSRPILKDQATTIFYWGLVLMAIALPLSKFLTGLALFIIAGAWLLEGNLASKFNSFFRSRFGLLFASIFFMHLFGLIYTEDFSFALKDLKIKLPLFLFPLFLSTSKPLSKEKLRLLLFIFIAAVIVSSCISMAVLFGWIERKITQVRDISFLISHIRFSLMICLAIFTLIYFIFSRTEPIKNKFIQTISAAWLIIFLFVLESFTGIIILIFIGLVLMLYFIFKRGNKFVRLFASLLLIAGLGFISTSIISNYKKVSQVLPIDLNHLDPTTKLGHPYTHWTELKETENGNYVYIYMCKQELDSVWSLNSKMDINGVDNNKQPLRVTLIRFLASKGKRKDAEGMSSLTEKEFRAIENGIANVDFLSNFSPSVRLRQIIWEINSYLRSGNPTGHSVTMRAEYVKTGWHIFKEHPLLGVGTGDIENAYQQKYEEEQSEISREWRLRAHNQYLTIAVTFGIFGFCWFVFSLVYPFVIQYKRANYFYLVFMLIFMLSMLNEDTIETQAGVTFFAFFNALLWFNDVQEHEKTLINKNA